MEILQIEGTFRLKIGPDGYEPLLLLENGVTLPLQVWLCGAFCTEMLAHCTQHIKINADEVHEAPGKLKITVELEP